MIRDFYQDKTVLLTGCTGFLGKVLLEKLLWSCPGIRKIFILIRPKKGMEASERFHKEIIQSPCFDRLRSKYPNFSQFVLEKLEVLPGDIQKESLGLSPAHTEVLLANVDVVINSAANVDFNQRLDLAIQNNVLGTMRMLDLCQRAAHIYTFVHISTAYVNSDKEGWIQEKFYPQARDPDLIIEDIRRVSVDEIEKRTPGFLGKFPNTYTFTKNLAEQLLLKRRGSVPLVVVRPTIIGGAWKEPYPGWVDSISAAGAFYLTAGLGVLKVALGNLHNIGDQIPCDMVTNTCIIAAAQHARTQEVQLFHSGSSSRNPLTWAMTVEPIYNYFLRNISIRSISKVNFKMYTSETMYKIMRFVKRTIPANLFQLYAHATRNQANIKLATRFKKVLERETMIAYAFYHFTKHEWIFDSQNVVEMKKKMTREDRKEFFIDIAKLNWKSWCVNFMYGLRKWVLKENVEQPADPNALEVNAQLISSRYFSDLSWAYYQKLNMKVRGQREIKSLVLNSERVQNAISALAVANELKASTDQVRKELANRAKDIVNRMVSDFQPAALRAFGWLLKKVWRQCYDKVLIDPKSLRTLKKLMLKKGSIVLAPTHRSYVDFLVISFILFMFGINVPFIAAREDFLRIYIVNHILRMSGAFFIKGKIAKDPLYVAVLTEYMQLLLRDKHTLEFFVEGTRSRTGKSLHPKFGLLSICTEAYFQKQIPDLHVVPVVISYERVLEGETFPFELLGEEKVQESLGRIIKAVKIFKMNFGKIFVNFGTPLTLSEFSQKHSDLSHTEITQKLGYELVYSFQDLAVIMPTAIVASLLLMNRRGVAEDELASKADWVQREIKQQNYRLGKSDSSGGVAGIKAAIKHLQETVIVKKDAFETTVVIKPDYKSILLLSYYRNTLIHAFIPHAYVACALFGFGEKLGWADGVQLRRLMEETHFLNLLLQAEFVSRSLIQSVDESIRPIQELVSRGVLERTADKIKVSSAGNLPIAYFCSLLWHLIDTYWLTVVFSYGLLQKKGLPLEKLVHSAQMFAESMYEEKVISFYESCSQESIKNAIQTLQKMKVLEVKQISDVKLVVLLPPYSQEEKLQELADHIGTFRKASLVKTVSAHEEIRKALLADYPHVPKL